MQCIFGLCLVFNTKEYVYDVFLVKENTFRHKCKSLQNMNRFGKGRGFPHLKANILPILVYEKISIEKNLFSFGVVIFGMAHPVSQYLRFNIIFITFTLWRRFWWITFGHHTNVTLQVTFRTTSDIIWIC